MSLSIEVAKAVAFAAITKWVEDGEANIELADPVEESVETVYNREREAYFFFFGHNHWASSAAGQGDAVTVGVQQTYNEGGRLMFLVEWKYWEA